METDGLMQIQNNPSSAEVYKALVGLLGKVGHYDIEVKKTSLHMVNDRAFLGVHPRKEGLLINIVTQEPLKGPRLKKTERVSAHRFHNEIEVKSPADLDDELQGWITQAYALTVRPK